MQLESRFHSLIMDTGGSVNEKEILTELEHAVEGMEQALMILATATAGQVNAGSLLQHLLEAETTLAVTTGANEWRDRFARKMQIGIAQIARRQLTAAEAQRPLLTTMLKPQPDTPDPQERH